MNDAEKVAALLEGARARMNDNGKHWTKGSFVGDYRFDVKEREYTDMRFCATGGIRAEFLASLGVEVTPLAVEGIRASTLGASAGEYNRALIAVARVLDEERMDNYASFYSDDEADLGWQALDIIVAANDKAETTWADVDGWFRKAIENVRAAA